MRHGTFITIEGGDGAGKTTLIAGLVERVYKETEKRTLTTREPGGIPIAESIRKVILNKSHTEMDARTEALLYAAARRQHLIQKVLPELMKGKIVICDRFIDSSLAYQGYARGLGIDAVWEINRFATEDCMPDITLYLDIDPEKGLQRIKANSTREVNRLDLEKLDFHQRVREGFLLVTEKFPERIVKLNADTTPEFLLESAWSVLEKYLANKNGTPGNKGF